MPEEVLIERASDGAASNATHTMVASTDYTVAAENHERDELIVSASGAADIWLSLGTAAAVVGTGIKVSASGPPVFIAAWKGAVHAISSGTPTLGATETSYHSGDDEGEEQSGADAFVPAGPSDTYYTDATAAAKKDLDWQTPGGSSRVPYPPQPS